MELLSLQGKNNIYVSIHDRIWESIMHPARQDDNCRNEGFEQQEFRPQHSHVVGLSRSRNDHEEAHCRRS